MPFIGFSLLAVLLSMYLTHADNLKPYGTNVQTKYESYRVREGASKLQYYYKRVCRRTCGAHLVFCWKKKWVCRNVRHSRWVTRYKYVTRYRPIYVCKNGWKPSGSSCTIPECYGCYNGGYCNRPWTCVCKSGWRGSRCRSDINECSDYWSNRCYPKSGCINTRGSYRCSCSNGYYLGSNRRTCNDIDECSRNSHSCSYKEGCRNTQGSYSCTCKAGYSLGDDQRTCNDVDECSTYENECSYKDGCQNTIGNYTCTCLPGYYLDADMRTCKDIIECENSDCEQGCINYPGGYNCSCFNGFRPNATDYKRCHDIDECSEKLAGCTQLCTNTLGGFNCSCNSGYYLSWDKRFCADIDECKGSQHGCQDHKCVNTLGSYKCRCRPGFQLSINEKSCTGKTCLPIYKPVNGNKTCSGYTTEHTCVFSCFVGYRLLGSRNRTCSASKRWIGKEAKCEPIHCPAPPEPANGFIYSPCNTRFNSECLAGCDKGYYMNETAKLTCTVNGTWESAKKTCNEIKVCEPNPCRHGGKCTIVTSNQFSCDCSNTRYQGITCEIGVIDIPDYPILTAGVSTGSVEFRVSPPDESVTLTPRGFGVVFNPPYLVFHQNATMSQSLSMTAEQPGLIEVFYYLSGPSAASFRKPERNTFFVQSAKNDTPSVPTYDDEEFSFSSGCYKLPLNKCPRSNETITAYSTSPWLIFGSIAITEDQVSLSTGNVDLLHSMTGISLQPEKRSSLNYDCEPDSSVLYSTAELVKNRALTKSFLDVMRHNLPKWLDIKLRDNLSLNFMVRQARYLTGKSLRQEAVFKGQPLSEDTFFSLLTSPDLDLFVNGDRVSLGLQNRGTFVTLALELCGPPPNNFILQLSPGKIDAMNKLTVLKQLQDHGWDFKIDSVQVSRGLYGRRLTMVATFIKNLDVSLALKYRMNFEGTIIVNVDNLNKIMDVPLDLRWFVELYGNAMLALEFKVHSKKTKLEIKMPQSQSYAIFGGKRQDHCSREMNPIPHGLRITSLLKENPFVRTELNDFIELDRTRNMSCFLSTIFYTDKQSNGSNYRETSAGVNMTFRGHLKFGTLRFDSLDVKLWMENLRCPNTAITEQSKIVAKFSGYYKTKETTEKKLGIFEILPDSVINLHIGQNSKVASGGTFSAIVIVLGFQNTVNVSISYSGLEFFAKGKMHGLFDSSATFKSPLVSWKNQLYTATGSFESQTGADNIYRILENELTKCSIDVLTKIQARLKLSMQTEERAKLRLKEVQIVRDEWLEKVKKITDDYEKVENNLGLAEENLKKLYDVVQHHSRAIQVLEKELDKLCKVVCNKICQKGQACTSCWKDTIGTEKGKCSATCHTTKQERVPPLIMAAICKNEHCKRIHAVHSWLGGLLIVAGIGSTSIGITPLVSLAVVGGVLSLVDKSQGGWKCKVKEDKCTKERFEYNYIHNPYKCVQPCEKRVIIKSTQTSCCSTVSCAYFVANVSCISEKTMCEKARKDALDKISKLNAAIILLNLDKAQKEVSVWKMRNERMFVKVRSASRSLEASQDAVSSLEKAYNVTVKNQKRKLEILRKPLMLKTLFNEFGKLLIKIESIKFETKVSEEHNGTLLPVSITMTLNGTQQEEISAVLDFTNLNRSLRGIAKDILGVYISDVSRISRKRRSTNGTYPATNELKFYTLQTYHRLCSEFSNHKRTLYDVAMTLYNLSSEIQQFREYEKQRKTLLVVNNSAIFEKFNFNQNKAKELGIDINYDTYSNVLEYDPELLEAKAFQEEVLKSEIEPVLLSSKLLYKNWLATMESIFETISDECSGFDDCLKYTIDSLSEINLGTAIPTAEKLQAQIQDIEVRFFNLTRRSNMSVNDAMKISWDILQILENMTGVEDVCAQAPNITENPVPFSKVGINETLILRCNATGDFLVYQWRFNGKLLKNETANVLRIKQTNSFHSGNYSCDVSNHVAKATSIIAVVVIGARPLIVHHPRRRRNIILSGYDSLLCQIKKGERNISYQWWFKPFNSNFFQPLPNQTFSRLSFAPVKIYHEGWYFCNVSNLFGYSKSRTSYVKVLKFSLPVPAAKLSLTVISKSHNSNVSVFYQDTLAKVFSSRFSNTYNNNSQQWKGIIKELQPIGCRIITQPNAQSSRTEICDWTLSVVGGNVTSNAVLNSTPSHQIRKIIQTTVMLKTQIGQLENETNGDGITFSMDKINFSVETNSLKIMSMLLFCPKRQYLVKEEYKCADCPPGSYGILENGKATCKICPLGFYQPNPSQTSCIKCPKGFITLEPGAYHYKQCKGDCPPGSYEMVENGVITCKTCPRSFYQPNPGQTSCIKCPEGSITAEQGAYDHKQCKADENKFFAVFFLVNNYHGDVLVTTNVSGHLEFDHLKPTEKISKSKNSKTKKLFSVSAVDATTNRTVVINGHSVIYLEPTIKDLVSLNVLYITADCLPGSYGIMENEITTCKNCPLGFYQSNSGQTSCIKCPEGFTTDVQGAYDHKQCKDENKFFAVFLLVNNYHSDVLVTTNVSGQLEIDHLKPTEKVSKSKNSKTKKLFSVSAVDATTNRTVDINGHSAIYLEPTIEELVSLNVLYITAPKSVGTNIKTTSTPTSALQTNASTTSTEKIVSTEVVFGRPMATEFVNNFKESSNLTEGKGQHG